MKKHHYKNITAWIILYAIILILINLNVFSFERVIPVRRSFYPESDTSGNQPVTQHIYLTRGSYRAVLSGVNENKYNGFNLYLNGELVLTNTFDIGPIDDVIPFSIEASAADVQIGVYYSQSPGAFRIEHIKIISDFVVLKENIIRHLFISLLLLALFVLLYFRLFATAQYRHRMGKFADPLTEKTMLFILMVSIIVSVPLLNSGFPQSTDLIFHLMRIEGIKESLVSGYLPARIYEYTLNGYGYGSGFFYPDLFLYIPAILRVLGFHILTAYKLFTLLCNFFSMLSMYLFVSRVAKSRFAGLIAAIFYSLAVYRLAVIYFRGALGEMQVFIFLPLVLWGLFDILNNQPDHWLVFAAGFSGLLLSHLIGLAISGVMTIFILLFYLDRIVKDRRIPIALGKAFLTTILLTTFFWAPMMEQILTSPIKANFLFSDQANQINRNYLLTLREIFSFFTNYSNIYQRFYFGYPLILIPLVYLLAVKKLRQQHSLFRFSLSLLLVGVIFLAAGTDRFPWEHFAWFYNRIQFPWRTLMVPVCCFAALGGLIWKELFKKRTVQVILATLAVCLIGAFPLFSNLMNQKMYHAEDFQLESNRISGAEWLPINADGEFIDKNGNTVLASVSDFITKSFRRKGLSFSVDFEISSESAAPILVEIPLLYYTGYRARLEQDGSDSLDLQVFQGPHGLTSTKIDPGIKSGTLFVWYAKTLVQRFSEGVSLITLILIILIHRRKINAGKLAAVNSHMKF